MRVQVKVRLEDSHIKELTAKAKATGQSVGQYMKKLVENDIKNKKLKVSYV